MDSENPAPGMKLPAITIPTGTYSYTYHPATGQLDTLTAPGVTEKATD